MKKISIVLLLFGLLVSFNANAQQHLLKTQGKIITNQNGDTVLLRGMGLGGWMLQEGYMLQTAGFANAQHKIRAKIEQLIGPADTDLFYDAWLANHVRKADIDSLKAWGFNSVRLPMHYNLFTLPIEDEPVPGQHTWLNKGFELTDSLVSWCKQNQMYVILDLHAAPGGQGYDEGISDYDTSKPSLWESPANQAKTVALWKKLAEHYAHEEWIAGYDLINEPNWNLPGGTALRNLYEEITDSIRTVDTSHIIFIEGNWFANDFTGLTPPWDSKLVYSPHKYWSINDQASIQWVLDMRNNYNVPLYLGESGENSNVWFRDAIRLLEDNNIGWAWWPMKKIESIAGPLSVIKTPEYESLLNYWNNGGTPPTAAFAKAALMQITDNLKIENCIYQKDVIDAMFRQVYADETVPYKVQDIPGVVYATDFSMGTVGHAYYDTEIANYQVSTGTYTSWNTGWTYRNDGVDIEKCTDSVNANGYNVGWTEAGEWIQYDIKVDSAGVYDVELRVASANSNGKFHFSTGGSAISPVESVTSSGGWQNWKTVTVSDVILSPSDTKIKFHFDGTGFNLSSMKFIKTSTPVSAVAANFQAAETIDEHTIKLDINKFFDATSLTAVPSNFQIFADGTSIPITNITIDAQNSRIAYFTVNHFMKFSEVLKISYSGTQVMTLDGTQLSTFTLEDVQNNLPVFHAIPGKIEAEAYFFQSGMQLETTTDAGGGQNIGFLDPTDYADYHIEVAQTKTYKVDFRNASEWGSGSFQLQLVDDNGNATTIHTQNLTPTGGWQTWTTTSADVALTAGQHTLRLLILQGPFNLNWMEFTESTNTKEEIAMENIKVFPNPTNDIFTIQGSLDQSQDVFIEIVNAQGQRVHQQVINNTNNLQENISLSTLADGYYYLMVRFENGVMYSNKLLKIRE